MKSTHKSLWWFVVLAGCGLLTPTVVYFYKFHGPLSDKPAVWAAFGDFLNPFISLLSVVAFVYLTYVVLQIEHRREQKRILLPRILEADRQLRKIEDLGKYVIHSWPTTERGTIRNLKGLAADFAQECGRDIKRVGIEYKRLQLALYGLITTVEAETVLPNDPTETIPEEHEDCVRELISVISDVKKMIEEYLSS